MKIFVVYLLLLIMSCSSSKKSNKYQNLLLITVENSETIKHGEYNKKLKVISQNIEEKNIYIILSTVLLMPKARNSVISINKNKYHDFYDAVIIYDDIPDDDSVSGYRYDIKMHRTKNDRWEFIEIKESWRCWENRGHREFSLLPCL